MPLGFMNNGEAQQRFAELSAAITAKGGTPKPYSRFVTSQEAHAAIAELEGQLAALTSSEPASNDLTRRLNALDAATKRLEAINAQARADRTKTLAKAAVAKATSRTPHLDKFNSLTGGARTHYYGQHANQIKAEQTLASHSSPDKLTIGEGGIVIESHLK